VALNTYSVECLRGTRTHTQTLVNTCTHAVRQVFRPCCVWFVHGFRIHRHWLKDCRPRVHMPRTCWLSVASARTCAMSVPRTGFSQTDALICEGAAFFCNATALKVGLSLSPSLARARSLSLSLFLSLSLVSIGSGRSSGEQEMQANHRNSHNLLTCISH